MGSNAEFQVSKLLAENATLTSQVSVLTKERDKAVNSRTHTWDWVARHYGKLEDWARKVLPEPWRTQYFSCVANGLYDAAKDVGEPYMSQVGRIVPGGYFTMETAQEQILFDHMRRAEEAESRLSAVSEVVKAIQFYQEIAELFGYSFGEYAASLDTVLQVKTYHCSGCAAEGRSMWPKWEVEFTHADDCRYIQARTALTNYEKAQQKEG